eukprot:TRINITY_DN2620_c0_g1_i10.p1 TRINITY_DN2620_c0_g1~~TRINITY_DN2620_c0_g1_i10.p1  ORF type:complete len:595 (+),score=179.50 TRINITY_DN2620_c0_g1_i10:65-1849(+)
MCIRDRFSNVLEDFPKLDDIHPFFADLLNVVVDKDHYKLALGHINTTRMMIDKVAKDYVRLLKYGDSLYRCKMLKRAALGRMMTILRKLKNTLKYLEEVRGYLARMPAIDPYTRTLLVCGFPNVGKSSFMNNVTHANVEVHSYPFTTQSLYVGHTDHLNVRWQVIDSPGILDHPLEQRNTIEMQTITGLAHLKACILWFIDISEECGYSIPAQINLYKTIRPLFAKKPHVIVLTKVDLKRFEDLSEEEQASLRALAEEESTFMLPLSNKSGEGVFDVKARACEILLEYRLEQNPDKLTGGSKALKSEEAFLKGIFIAYPKQRDDKERPPQVPEGIVSGEKPQLGRPTLKELQEQHGGAGVFNFPVQEHFILENDDWKYDQVPEIMDGKNIFDFVDKDILQHLEALEREEEMLLREQGVDMEDEAELLDKDYELAYQQIKSKRAQLKLEHKMKRHRTAFPKRKDLEEVKEGFEEKGLPVEAVEQRFSSNVRKRRGRDLDEVIHEAIDNMDIEDGGDSTATRKKFDKKMRSLSRSRSKGYKKELTPREEDMDRLRKKIQKEFRHTERATEADRSIPVKMPKHLFSGKRGIGKTDRR